MPKKAKVKPYDHIIRMVRHVNSGKMDSFYNQAQEYCDSLKTISLNDKVMKDSLQLAINNKPLGFKPLQELSTETKKLFTELSVNDISDNIYISNDVKILFDELIKEWKNKDLFRSHNLPIRNKILFYGTTGNGKTTLARYVAKMTGLNFLQINTEQVIDSKIGQSAKNINAIFNEITQPCVLFWDEIDGIGMKRGTVADNAASLENERMVNAILVNIERLKNEVIFMGATNRYDILDSAFLRRFDIHYEIMPPEEVQKRAFLKQSIDYYNLPSEYLETNISELKSYAEIKNLTLQMARHHVINQIKNVEAVNN